MSLLVVHVLFWQWMGLEHIVPGVARLDRQMRMKRQLKAINSRTCSLVLGLFLLFRVFEHEYVSVYRDVYTGCYQLTDGEKVQK